MKKKVYFDKWGEEYLLRDEQRKIGLFKYITKEKDYCVFLEREIPSYSGPPLTKYDLIEIGTYFNKKDLESKFYNASINYSQKTANELKSQLINNKANLSEGKKGSSCIVDIE